MLEQVEFISAFGLISKMNRARYEDGERLTEVEQKELNDWIAKSESNRLQYERYTRKEWLYWGDIRVREIRYILCIEDLLFSTFQIANGQVRSQHFRYLFLTSLFVVVGLSDEELTELKAWAKQSPENKRAFELFTTDKYAPMAIEMLQKFTNVHLFHWYMNKYHTKKEPKRNFLRRLFKK